MAKDDKGHDKSHADEKKSPEGGKTKESSSKAEFLVEMLTGLFGHKIGDAMTSGAIRFFTNRAEGLLEDKPKNLICFGEALTKLRAEDEYSYEVINDFMRVELTAEYDRDDFQVRTAKMGGDKVNVTVAFLQLVAAEPDHASRREFLDSMGVIGERALDPYEKAKLLGKKAMGFVKTRGAAPLAWIKSDLDGAFTELTRSAQANNDRLRIELARLRAEAVTPPAPATPPTGPAGRNRFTRALNALLGR